MEHEAFLYKKFPENTVQCALCAHRCRIAPGKFGICGVRENKQGKFYTHAYGEVIAAHVDPIEKKPLFHFLPGSRAFSVATIGCNFKCDFCQNWQISQESFRDRSASPGEKLSCEEIVAQAVAHRCKTIAYTYTEPTRFFDYAYDTARIAKGKGLRNCFVTNGYMTEEALDMIRPYLDAANVDLKFFNDDSYKKICAGGLAPVLDTIRRMKEKGVWVEVTTLVVPGLNDSDAELRDIAAFLAATGKDIPWHISRFYPQYRAVKTPPTPRETLERAQKIGRNAGLHYIYIGNVDVSDDNTYCAGCGAQVIQRRHFSVESVSLVKGACAHCGAKVDGVF
jgi:pyruvate formate lyase activating enzyme